VRLAATLPLSSGDSSMGRLWRRGYERAVQEVNRNGGVFLRATRQRVPLVLQILDDGGDLARAEQGAAELLSSGVHVLLATPGGVRMAAQASVAGKFARPYLVPAQSGPELTATDRPWVLVAPRDGGSEEERAYETALAAIDALQRARSLDGEAVRRALIYVD
jgi:ABC-type branched-subunit amino acid transport system substrate-binding protein